MCRQKVNLASALFSFTPSKICDGVCVPRERCVLDNIKSLNRHLRTAVFNNWRRGFYPQEAVPQEIKDVWNEIVDQVVKQGFVLGVHFDWPKTNKIEA